jgi:hypothetical protein
MAASSTRDVPVDEGLTRTYRAPGYPVTPVLFCLYSGYMVYTSLDYAIGQRTWEAVWSVEILLIGAVLSIFAVYPLGRVGKILSGLALSAAGAAATIFRDHLAQQVLGGGNALADARNEVLLAAIPLLALGLIVLAAGLWGRPKPSPSPSGRGSG